MKKQGVPTKCLGTPLKRKAAPLFSNGAALITVFLKKN
jgi:hypothetical protein